MMQAMKNRALTGLLTLALLAPTSAAAMTAKFGLREVSEACITPDVRPFTCKKADQFLFWDGVHPTKAVHAIFAQEAAFALGIDAQK